VSAEQLEFLGAEVVEHLDDSAALRLRVAELEEQVEGHRRTVAAERNRRQDAETSRDEWVAIAQGHGVQLGRTQDLGDPAIALRAAQRDTDYIRKLLAERDRDILATRQVAEALAHFARLVPKLPATVKALPHSVLMALFWALQDRHYDLQPAPKMPAEQQAAVAAYHADWQKVLGYSARQVAGVAE
jgi:hypothetical protein